MCTFMGDLAKVVAKQVLEGERTEQWGKDFLHQMAEQSIAWVNANLARGKIDEERAKAGIADAQKYLQT